MFKLRRNIGWNFPNNDEGQESGLNDPGIETFKDHPLTSLAREVLQIRRTPLRTDRPSRYRFILSAC